MSTPLQKSLLQSIKTHPHTLPQVTSQYLHTLVSPSHPSTTTWPSIHTLMTHLSTPNLPLEQYMLLLNVLRCIVGETFGAVNGAKDNRMFCWLAMSFGARMGELVQEIERLGDGRREELAKLVCIGLILCEIVIGLAEDTKQTNTANRVIYPEIYRFVNIALATVEQIGRIDISIVIKLAQQKQQQQQWQQKSTIKTTRILQSLLQSPKPGKKAIKNPKKPSQSPSNPPQSQTQPGSYIIAKIIQLLSRSFSLCKGTVIQKMHIVNTTINDQIRQFLGEEAEQEGKQGQREAQDVQERSLQGIIKEYLNSFKPKGAQQQKQEQFDEQNQIIQVKQLTPRFVDEQAGMQLKKLRTKKKKLIKKLESDARTAKMNKLQQRKVLQDVRNERVAKKQKKEIFVLQKQTQQAKKAHNKTKKIKQIQKQGKSKGKSQSKISGPGKRFKK